MSSEWQRVLEVLDVAVLVHDRTLRVVYANRKALSLLGATMAQLAAWEPLTQTRDVIAPDGTPVGSDAYPVVRAFQTRQAVTGVTLGIRRGDTADVLWILVSAVPELDEDGSIARVAVSFSDVSGAQRAIREQETLYQTVFRSMSEGIAVLDADGTIRAANPAAERVLGVSVDQMAGRAATDSRWRLVNADGTPLGAGDIPSERARRSGQSVAEHIIGVHRPGGELAWLSVRADPLKAPGDERVHGVVATFTDVTKPRETQLALEDTRAHTQRVLDAVPGVVFQYLAPAGEPARFPFVAGRIQEVLGLDPEVVRANPNLILGLLETDQLSALGTKIVEAAAVGRICEFDAPFRRADGQTRWLRIHGRSEQTPDGLLCTGMILDVTEAHHLAEVLRRAQRREAMADMAAGIAHNFNNMLAVIIPNLELARTQLREPARTLIDEAERAATRAAELVRRMLALGRGDGVEPEGVVDLVGLTREVVQFCRQSLDGAVAIDERIALSSAPVRGDAAAVHQVLLNLCINARDALAGRPEPRLSITLEGSGTGEVILIVSDSGIGMAPDVLRRIGEPFFTTKPPGQGTGLGVASALQTIAEVGGSWMIDSTPGRGTAVTVRFPLIHE
jgi:PAS domain S-box-containing protein